MIYCSAKTNFCQMAPKWTENHYLSVILWFQTFKMAKIIFASWKHAKHKWLSYVKHAKKKNNYRPIKKCLVMILHLRTKKIYFGQKKPNCFKKRKYLTNNCNTEEISNEISKGCWYLKKYSKWIWIQKIIEKVYVHKFVSMIIVGFLMRQLRIWTDNITSSKWYEITRFRSRFYL